MPAPIIAFAPSWVTGSLNPAITPDLFAAVAGDTVYLKIGRDITFATFDQNVAHVLTQPEIDAFAFSWDIGTMYNGVNYFRVTFNSEDSNILTDTITAGTDAPSESSSPTTGGYVPTHPKKIKAEKERRERQKKNQDDIEDTIRLAYQRLTGKVTEPPILQQEATPERLAVHAEKLAAQLVEKSKNSAKQRERNKAIIADLQRQANAIMQEEEEAIIMLLH